MFTFIAICIVIVCVLLTLIVLAQNSKGGGLVSSFSSSNQIMGVKKTADFLEKTTWILAVLLFALCLASAAVLPNANENQNIDNIGNMMEQETDETIAPVTPIEESTTTETTTAE